MALGQTEIFTPAPTRRLIVPEGHTSWWGVDPSTRHVAIAVCSGEDRYGIVTPIEQLSGVQRLRAVRWAALESARPMLVLHGPPGVIVCEQPSGTHQNLQLVYAVGVILSALADLFPATVIETVTSPVWKRDVCGHGGIRKPKPAEKRPYDVLLWAQAHGYAGTDWDQADAWAIAEYARRTFALDAR